MRALGYVTLATAAAMSAALVGSPSYADSIDEPAPAVSVLTSGALGGAAVAVGDVLTASIAAGTTANFATASGGNSGVKCATSSFTATVIANPVAPGVATESTTAQTFGSCTTNVLGATGVRGVVVNNVPFATTVSSSGVVTVTGTDAAPIQTTLQLNTILGSITCVYRADGGFITGSTGTTDSSISFNNQKFNKTSGPITCPANGFFTANYTPVVDTTLADGSAVFTN